MTIAEVNHTAKDVLVGMGQIAAGRAPLRMKAVLGSCIGLAIFHPRIHAGVMAHIVLPESAGRNGSAGKFADTAIPEMLRLLKQMGIPPAGLIAKFAGGANMFNGSGPLQIGDANAKAVRERLQAAGIRIAAHEIGGTKGRRVTFDCCGQMAVECSGQPPRVL